MTWLSETLTGGNKYLNMTDVIYNLSMLILE